MNPEEALAHVAARLRKRGVRFALVGGLAVSVRGEVRFTRDVDLAIVVESDADLQARTRELAGDGYVPVAVVEQDDAKRIAIARLRSPTGVVVDLLAASTGIEREIVDAATSSAATEGIPVASAEHLLAMKVLSMREGRLQDRLDALGLLAIASPDLDEVRRALRTIEERGFARGQDLLAKLDVLLQEARES